MAAPSPLLLQLPIPDPNPQLVKEKKTLLQNLGLDITIDLAQVFQNEKDEQKILDQILQTTRITMMMDEELYFASSELIQENDFERAKRLSYISPINEFRTLKCAKRCLTEVLSSVSALSNDGQNNYQSAKISVEKMLQRVRQLCSNFCSNEKPVSHGFHPQLTCLRVLLSLWTQQQRET